MKRALLGCCVLGVLASPASAITVDVNIQNFAFNPGLVAIGVGDTVRWTNNDFFFHSVTSNTLVFDSGMLAPGDQFSFTFNSADVFNYHCDFHTFMTGSVEVVPEPATWLALSAGGFLLIRRKR